jgi:hypothetical protein
MCLGHTVGNKVTRAYKGGDLLEERRALLEAWSAFVTGPGVPRLNSRQEARHSAKSSSYPQTMEGANPRYWEGP